MDRAAPVGLEVFDLLGRSVYSLSPRVYTPGEHSITVDPGLVSGVYLLRVEVGEGEDRRRLDRTVVVGR